MQQRRRLGRSAPAHTPALAAVVALAAAEAFAILQRRAVRERQTRGSGATIPHSAATASGRLASEPALPRRGNARSAVPIMLPHRVKSGCRAHAHTARTPKQVARASAPHWGHHHVHARCHLILPRKLSSLCAHGDGWAESSQNQRLVRAKSIATSAEDWGPSGHAAEPCADPTAAGRERAL